LSSKTRSTTKQNAEEILVCFVVTCQCPFCDHLAHHMLWKHFCNLHMHYVFSGQIIAIESVIVLIVRARVLGQEKEVGAFGWCVQVHVPFLSLDNPQPNKESGLKSAKNHSYHSGIWIDHLFFFFCETWYGCRRSYTCTHAHPCEYTYATLPL